MDTEHEEAIARLTRATLLDMAPDDALPNGGALYLGNGMWDLDGVAPIPTELCGVATASGHFQRLARLGKALAVGPVAYEPTPAGLLLTLLCEKGALVYNPAAAWPWKVQGVHVRTLPLVIATLRPDLL